MTEASKTSSHKKVVQKKSHKKKKNLVSSTSHQPLSSSQMKMIIKQLDNSIRMTQFLTKSSSILEIPDEEKKSLREQWIPYIRSMFKKGTQYPTFRLYITSQTISTLAATDYVTVLSIQASILLNFSSLAVVFDEYRVIVGEVMLYRNRSYMDPSGSIKGVSVAVIDYDDSAPLSTFDGGIQYDTKKIFPVCTYDNDKDPVRWPLLFEPLPDQEWLTTATTNNVFCSWKPFLPISYTDGPALGSVAMVTGWVDVQFRNMF